MSYPVEMVTTKIGKVRIMATGRKTLYVSTDHTDYGDGQKIANYVTVRGINYRGSIHLEDYGNGYELHKNSAGWTGDAVYLSRENHYGRNEGVSDSARKVITETLVAAALEWVKANPKAPILAGIHEEERTSERLMSEVAELEKKVYDIGLQASAARARRLAYLNSLEEIGK